MNANMRQLQEKLNLKEDESFNFNKIKLMIYNDVTYYFYYFRLN